MIVGSGVGVATVGVGEMSALGLGSPGDATGLVVGLDDGTANDGSRTGAGSGRSSPATVLEQPVATTRTAMSHHARHRVATAWGRAVATRWMAGAGRSVRGLG